MRGVAARRSSEEASPRGAPRPLLRKHQGAGQSPRDHPEEPGAAGGYSTAAGTTRLRGSGPDALQHLARSRRLSPSIASPELKKKKKKKSQWLRSPEPPLWWQLPREHQQSARAEAGPARPVASRGGSHPQTRLQWPGLPDQRRAASGAGREGGGWGPAPHHCRAGRGKEVGWEEGDGRGGSGAEIFPATAVRRRVAALAPLSRCSRCPRPRADWLDAILARAARA